MRYALTATLHVTRKLGIITIKFLLQLPLCYTFVRIVSNRLETNILLMHGYFAS
jgi:hypothetical protein